jgi:acyl-CoA thioester hydrolase
MELESFKHIKKIEIRYDDLDILGHVNNKAYLSYLEEARIDYHKQLFQWKNELEFNSVVVKIEINYRKPLFYGDKLQIHTRLSNIGTTSFELESVFVKDGANSEFSIIAADARVVLVSIDPKSGKPVRIPEKEKNILLNFENPDNVKDKE